MQRSLMSSLGDNACIMTIADLTPNKFGSFEMFTVALSKLLRNKRISSVVVFNGMVPAHLRHLYEGMIVETVSTAHGLWAYYKDMYSIIKRYRPSLVHFHFFAFFDWTNLPVLLMLRNPIVFTDHSSIEPKQKTGLFKMLVLFKNKLMDKFIEKIICVSEYVATRNLSVPGINETKLLCMYNGVCNERFQPASNRLAGRKGLGLRKDQFVVVTAANLIKEKGIDYLLHGAKMLSDKYRDLIFLIAGDGTERKELEKLVSDLKLADHVRFLGMRNNVEQILAASDVYLYPSIWQEACALGLIEAMACGLPIIATNVGGTPEIVVDGVNGIIIKPEDSVSIADALEILYHDRGKTRRMGLNSLKRARDIFNLDRQVNDLVSVYDECIV